MRSTTKAKATKRALVGMLAGFTLLTVTERNVEAQEILLTGPLAGAPAVRKQRLYREGRIELAPVISFTLLDEYKRQIMPGVKVNYNIADWIAIGLWGSVGLIDPLQIDTDLADRIQRVNRERRDAERQRDLDDDGQANDSIGVLDANGDGFPDQARNPQILLTRSNLGEDFRDQTSTIDWIIAPQLTLIPFRGKLALFQAAYVDTDLHLFVGPAIIGLNERADCESGACFGAPLNAQQSFDTSSRIAFSATFGVGFTFFVNKWNSFGFDYRLTPVKRNTGGFDIAGGGPGKEFPDLRVNAQDRELEISQMISLQWSFYFPQQYRISE